MASHAARAAPIAATMFSITFPIHPVYHETQGGGRTWNKACNAQAMVVLISGPCRAPSSDVPVQEKAQHQAHEKQGATEVACGGNGREEADHGSNKRVQGSIAAGLPKSQSYQRRKQPPT